LSRFFSGKPRYALNTLTLLSAAILRFKGICSYCSAIVNGFCEGTGGVVGSVDDRTSEVFAFELGSVCALMKEKIDFEDSGDAMVSSLKCVVEIVYDMG
jgi:hypothetical protein